MTAPPIEPPMPGTISHRIMALPAEKRELMEALLAELDRLGELDERLAMLGWDDRA